MRIRARYADGMVHGTSRRGVFRFLVACAISCLIFISVLAVPARAATAVQTTEVQSKASPLVVVGFSGLAWENVTEQTTPNLWKFAEGAGVANVVVRTVGETTCPAAGWLTIASGQRALDTADGCRTLASVAGGGAADWTELSEANLASSYGAQIGLLADSLEQKNAVAIGAGAALALTDSSGDVSAMAAEIPDLPGSEKGTAAGAADPGVTAAADAYAQLASGADVIVVDLGSVRYPDAQLTSSPAATADPGVREKLQSAFRSIPDTPTEVDDQVAALDARFGTLLEQITTSTPGASVIATSVGDSQNQTAELGYFAMTSLGGSEEAESVLATSDATRQPGLVQLTDVFPTIMAALDSDSAALEDSVGSHIYQTSISGSRLPERLADDQVRSDLVRANVGVFYIGLIVFFVLTVGMGIARMQRGGDQRRDATLIQLATWVASIPVASLLINLLPWWRSDSPRVALFGGITAIATFIAAIALFPKWKDKVHAPLAVVGSISALTLLCDVVLDSRLGAYPLQLASLLGTQPQVGGRFYGLSNATFAVMAAGLLLATAYAAELLRARWGKNVAAAVVVAIAVVAVIIDGSAGLGADFGGPPALIVGFAFLTVLAISATLSWLRVVVVLGAAVLVSFGFAVADYLRPPDQRSHLGRFIQTLLNGGGMEVTTRKLSQSFFGLPWTAVAIFFAVLVAVVVLLRNLHARGAFRTHLSPRLLSRSWRDVPVLKSSVVSLCAALAVGFLINDSGVVVPFIGFCVAVPLWLVTILRHDDELDQETV